MKKLTLSRKEHDKLIDCNLMKYLFANYDKRDWNINGVIIHDVSDTDYAFIVSLLPKL